ncbi:squalene--hopene cyclase [Sutcliffiella halmapala]|uniref:squalene--hopene cyclase n=1 Tax=Sutcliffiella halmapala TaxID=79882 RepID=UPI000994D4DF|nr:squalene--hopene cyclase [Sutcliffiella halmapala]
MSNKEAVQSYVNQLIEEISALQHKNGRWEFCFQGTLMTDAYMIILLRALNIKGEEELIKGLVNEILTQQQSDGTWKIYHDEQETNISATIEAYFALLYSGYVTANEPNMQNAKRRIVQMGGLSKAEILTRTMLSLTTNIPWPSIAKIFPIEIMSLPKWAPVNIYDFVGYSRVHWVPIMICSNLNFSFTHHTTPDLSSLYSTRETESAERLLKEFSPLVKGIKQQAHQLLKAASPSKVKKDSFKIAEEFIIERIEPNGTLFSYFSSTFFMIFALLALGYKKNDPIISNAINGMKSYLYQGKNNFFHMQNSPSEVWDTALLSSALQNAGVSPTHSTVTNAAKYLLSRQQTKYGDWAVKNPDTMPGGWGFSDCNTRIPDVDDTTAALRAIQQFVHTDPAYELAWNKGTNWLLSMQNNDGGWAAFEKNTANYLVPFYPFRYEDRVLFDPSTADLTGRTLYFLGEYTDLTNTHSSIKKGVEWLIQNQEKDGSWYGRWGICFIYGTWAALTGMAATELPANHPAIEKAMDWLYSIQNKDGGWGESCVSDYKKRYIPLHASTPSQTAWALEALISFEERPNEQIIDGIHYLLNSKDKDDWTIHYPTGAGIPGSFYVHYHSYRYIWPLQTLATFLRKFGKFI